MDKKKAFEAVRHRKLLASIVGVVVHGIEGDLHGTRYGSRLILRTRERLAATNCRFNCVVVCRQSRAFELHRVAGLFAIGQQIDAIDGLMLAALNAWRH